MAATPFGGLGAPNMDQMAAMGIPGANLNPQVRTGTGEVRQCQRVTVELTPVLRSVSPSSGSLGRLPEARAVHGPKVRTSKISQRHPHQRSSHLFPEKAHDCSPRRLNPLAAGLNLNPGMKADASNKEIEEAMKRVREAQSLISAAIEPGSECLGCDGSPFTACLFNSVSAQVKRTTSANILARAHIHGVGARVLAPDTGEDAQLAKLYTIQKYICDVT